MDRFYEFMRAALPWICMGLLLAIFFVREGSGKKRVKAEYGSEGMALGMCLGVAISTAVHMDVGIGMMAGMVLGLMVGSRIEKKSG